MLHSMRKWEEKADGPMAYGMVNFDLIYLRARTNTAKTQHNVCSIWPYYTGYYFIFKFCQRRKPSQIMVRVPKFKSCAKYQVLVIQLAEQCRPTLDPVLHRLV